MSRAGSVTPCACLDKIEGRTRADAVEKTVCEL